MRILHSLATLLTLSLLAGCMTTDQGLSMQREMLDLKRKVESMERSLKALQDDQAGGVRAQVDTLARNQADFQATLDGLRVDLQGMRGQYENNGALRRELQQEMTLMKDELGLQLADLSQRMSVLEERSKAPAPAPSPTPTTVVPPAPATAVPAPVPTPTPAGESATELYERALKAIRENQAFAEGRELMQTFLKRYPEDVLAVNAAYWVGETYYAEKAYDKAVLQFEDVIQAYGDHPKVASALLKQGLAFEALGDRANAKLLMKKVLDQFPLAEEATLAKAKLKDWGG